MPSVGKVRNLTIDRVKGLAALLVVYGHIIQYIICRNENIWDNRIFCFIYSFHMPLFMFISGYLCYRNDGHDLNWLKRRTINLLIPFLVWGIFRKCLFLGESIKDIFRIVIELFLYPDRGGYWFLFVLLECCVIIWLLEHAFILMKIENLCIKFAIIGIIVCLFRFVFSKIGYGGLGILGWEIFFFMAGYCIHILYICSDIFKNILKIKYLHIVVAVLFPLLSLTWRNNINLMQLLGGDINSGVFYVFILKVVMLIYTYLVPMVGIAFSFLLMSYLKENIFTRILEYLGKYTYEMYILQVLFIREYTHSIIINVIICLLLSTVVSILIVKIVERFPKFNKVLFGKKETKIHAKSI